MLRSPSIWSSAVVSLASLVCVTCASGGGGAAAGEPNICDAWKLWTAQDKERFLVPIWKKTLAAVQAPLAETSATPEQIGKYNDCFNARMPVVSGDVDRVCNEPGAEMDSEGLATMASAHVPTCMEEAGIRG